MDLRQTQNFSESVIFAGGRLCLDFVNTSCMRLGLPMEFIGDTEALNRWLEAAARIYGVPERWQAHDAVDSLSHAYELRSALKSLIDGARMGSAPSGAAITVVNTTLRSAPAYLQLEAVSEGFGSSQVSKRTDDPWLAEIARDALDLLCHADPSLLRQCECATCVRFFYDTTKNHARRWCIEKCGSRVKAANYYRRKRLAKAAAPSV
jgi:predicted RNA-binding Zn ribbon-like protein